jgi:hypothetical protein
MVGGGETEGGYLQIDADKPGSTSLSLSLSLSLSVSLLYYVLWPSFLCANRVSPRAKL